MVEPTKIWLIRPNVFLSARARNVRFLTHVWRTQNNKIQNRTWKLLLRMRTLKKIYIPHRFVAVSNGTFHARSRKVYRVQLVRESAPDSREVCNTSRRPVFGSIMARIANFTHSWGIVLISHLLHNILFLSSQKFCIIVDDSEIKSHRFFFFLLLTFQKKTEANIMRKTTFFAKKFMKFPIVNI